MSHYRVIGTRPHRVDGVEKVTGAARYGADVKLPGMLYARVLRSPHPHARVVSLDVSAAAAHPAVLAVVTGADFPRIGSEETAMGETSIDLMHLQEMVCGRTRVLFKGHPIAAVAATSPAAAAEALRLIRVEYEVLPPVTDVLHALQEDAPVLHANLDGPGARGNIAANLVRRRGDVAAGFAAADVVVERTFRVQWVHQGYIEPTACVARVQPGGRLEIFTCTQDPFGVRSNVAQLLQMPEGQIRVEPMEVGGGFGGKTYTYLEPLAALLARKSGRPVKLAMSRQEVFEATGPSPGAVIRVKLGAKKTGELTAAEAWMAYDAGAYPGSAFGAGMTAGLSLYRIPNLLIEGFDVVTNKPRCAAYRAPGAPQAAFACEQVIDEMAQRLGMDPVEFRLRNAQGEGDPMTNGRPFTRIGFREVLEAVRRHPCWTDPPPAGPYAGRGMAAGMWGNWHGTSTAHVTFDEQGHAYLTIGSVDLTGSRTAMAQILAEELGLPLEQVHVHIGNTDTVPFNDGTGGSRVTYATGTAVHRAALDARQQLAQRAARLLEAAPEDVEYVVAEARFVVKGTGRGLPFAEVVAQQQQTGGPVLATGAVSGLQQAPGVGVHVVDLQVDPETGRVRILRYTAFQDVGKAIHPTYVEGQLQGGAVQGLGWALTEEYAWKDGVMQNPSLLDYRILTALDVPSIETVLIEVPASDGPYGVRGVGETPIVPPLAAVANALQRATGARFTESPMTPERIWRGLQQQRSPAAD